MSVWQRQKNWWNEVLWKPKKPLSIDQLKFQYQVLQRNPVVTDNNKHLIVETFRSIAEILIWGDQNDSRVFDFFLEKNMQSFFLKILTQKCGRYVCLQLLQTLNILFENIRNETSIYYLLSNNHVNSIIVLKLDFSDEEVLAYYISFLKTLSFKLNKHTINFFYNEHLRDFPLYTEAIKFFNHSESMVRIAVRTLTLNVYRVNEPSTLAYICNKTAVPYFSNLIWFIGNHVIELDECLISQAHHLNMGRLEQLVAEHLDHLHYISDILSLNIECLNDILTDHLLNRLLIPLYVYSLTDQSMSTEEEDSPRISSTISLFLLSQVFLILSDSSVVTPLAYLILTGDITLALPPVLQYTHKREGSYSSIRGFVRPEASLETSLAPPFYKPASPVNMRNHVLSEDNDEGKGSSTESQSQMREYVDVVVDSQYVVIEATPPSSSSSSQITGPRTPPPSPGQLQREREARELKDQQKLKEMQQSSSFNCCSPHLGIPVASTVFLDTLMGALSVKNDDSRCLFALCLIYAMLQNKGVHPKLLEAFSLRPHMPESGSPQYNSELVTLLLAILDTTTASGNSIRLVTLRLATMLLKELLGSSSSGAMLQDHHIALVENIYESSILQLRLFYKGAQDEIFLDMFEDEFNNEKKFQLKVPFLMMDASMLLPPTDTPLTGIEFARRLPCGETERARKAMRVFFAIRRLSQELSSSDETELPLTMESNSAKTGEIVDLKNCDLVSCVVTSGTKSTSHFMVVTETEFLLVDPDKTKLGWGVVHFIAFLQDVDVTADPADSLALFITVHGRSSTQKRPALSARFQFEDHIRCIAAKQVLQRYREHLRLAKMTRVAKLLHLPIPEIPSSISQPMPVNKLYLDPSLPSVISLSPSPQPTSLPMFPPNQSQVTSSLMGRVFMPPAATPYNTQEFEMTAFNENGRTSHPLATHEMDVFNSPIKLAAAMPEDTSGTTPEVKLDPSTLEARFYRDKSSTPETTPLQQSFDSHLQLTDSSQTDHEVLVQLSGGELETSIQEQLGTSYEAQKDVGMMVELSELKSKRRDSDPSSHNTDVRKEREDDSDNVLAGLSLEDNTATEVTQTTTSAPLLADTTDAQTDSSALLIDITRTNSSVPQNAGATDTQADVSPPLIESIQTDNGEPLSGDVVDAQAPDVDQTTSSHPLSGDVHIFNSQGDLLTGEVQINSDSKDILLPTSSAPLVNSSTANSQNRVELTRDSLNPDVIGSDPLTRDSSDTLPFLSKEVIVNEVATREDHPLQTSVEDEMVVDPRIQNV